MCGCIRQQGAATDAAVPRARGTCTASPRVVAHAVPGLRRPTARPRARPRRCPGASAAPDTGACNRR
ncbi:hypothetical protein EIQ06_22250 [Xanthomonas campestris pv. campestris]|nr:hypothetical protein DFG55_07750 [Xanthomonas campestris pv. campestris]QCX73158.1 hypothetical protein DFG54_22665 [Xanthomonas campestris pv. campestris]RFF42462.1 hypothetical protein D0A42_15120 [Xanthomonas campestris pv. campestris]RFF76437.1 hypothetical protein DZE36_03820 [Xanthomonas campestris pv. campestris]